MRILIFLIVLVAPAAAGQSPTPDTLDAPTRARLQVELREMTLADQRIRFMWEYGVFSPCRADSLRDAMADLETEAYIARSQKLRAEAATRVTDAERAVLDRMMRDTDATIFARLREIIAAHGWPSDARTGAEANPFLFLLHAPHHIDEMRDVLLAEVQAGRLSARHFAMAVDKSRKVRGEDQLYGTGDEYDAETATILPPKVESIEATNAARREIGMEPLEDYRTAK